MTRCVSSHPIRWPRQFEHDSLRLLVATEHLKMTNCQSELSIGSSIALTSGRVAGLMLRVLTAAARAHALLRSFAQRTG